MGYFLILELVAQLKIRREKYFDFKGQFRRM
jgi:hypothetical protein